ncbi:MULTISPECIES: LysR family transcriptional regulator [unclassified Microbacterium]|uniref:LysR family transcriptional regulator n=1 Tax=unclassified Microbacterium TaxID=2609290 RepID=UPI00214CD63C|nr:MULTISPECIES: LysR family transcriptional regulator [unclassified Microbacterium]MCR2784618.1 LysR family transcriptional regulator [Microbacterium sp. zg.B96]MDL5353051.1 LysR family transcriptional regulator [Microbacterium sp. zg-YB36]WIM16161.1 LysR family transcriptional regulator [Microbacterium sp. zg-B96]
MDRLVVMKTFVTVAKSSSFSGAARELGISGSLVSRHVADLERQIGVRLVNRTARSVSLTDAGRRYAEFSERVLGEIEEEDVSLSQARDLPEGPLSVICPKWIGTLDVGDAIAAFVREHPKITLRFELGGMSDRNYDFLDRGYDVAFHTRDLRDSNVLIRRVSELPFVLAASAAYLARNGVPQTVAELSDFDCILHPNDPVWRLGEGEDTVHHKIVDPKVVANSYLVIEKLLEHDCGIALIPRNPAEERLASGELVEVLAHLRPPARALYAVHGPGGQTPERVRIFLDFMTAWFRSRTVRVEA